MNNIMIANDADDRFAHNEPLWPISSKRRDKIKALPPRHDR
jgi:hypothetical protein